MRLTKAQDVLHFARKLLKIASVSGASPQTRWGILRRSSRLVARGLLAFGAFNSLLGHSGSKEFI